jgi:hypothetical protein
MGGNRSLNEAFNKSLKLEAAKKAPGPPGRLLELTLAPMGTRPPPAERRRYGRPVFYQCGKAVTSGETAEEARKEVDQNWGESNSRREEEGVGFNTLIPFVEPSKCVSYGER